MKAIPIPEFPRGTGAGCPSVVRAEGARFAGLADGTVMVIGLGCDRAPLAVSFRAGAAGWTPAPLPTTAGEVVSIAAVSAGARELWVAGGAGTSAYLARFEGKAWSRIAVPVAAPLTAIASGPEGSAWVASASWVARYAGTAFLAATPHEGELEGITSLALDGATLWIGAASKRPTLWSTRPSATVLAIPDRETLWSTLPQTGHLVASDACSSPWVALSKIGTSGGYVPKDLPWLREGVRAHPELAGVRFVLDDDGKKTILGAVVPSIAAGDRVVLAFGDQLGIAGARVVCHTPKAIRRYEDGVAVDP